MIPMRHVLAPRYFPEYLQRASRSSRPRLARDQTSERLPATRDGTDDGIPNSRTRQFCHRRHRIMAVYLYYTNRTRLAFVHDVLLDAVTGPPWPMTRTDVTGFVDDRKSCDATHNLGIYVWRFSSRYVGSWHRMVSRDLIIAYCGISVTIFLKLKGRL